MEIKGVLIYVFLFLPAKGKPMYFLSLFVRSPQKITGIGTCIVSRGNDFSTFGRTLQT